MIFDKKCSEHPFLGHFGKNTQIWWLSASYELVFELKIDVLVFIRYKRACSGGILTKHFAHSSDCSIISSLSWLRASFLLNRQRRSDEICLYAIITRSLPAHLIPSIEILITASHQNWGGNDPIRLKNPLGLSLYNAFFTSLHRYDRISGLSSEKSSRIVSFECVSGRKGVAIMRWRRAQHCATLSVRDFANLRIFSNVAGLRLPSFQRSLIIMLMEISLS